ncbi:type ISP restriction/modification enzyme [Mucilaginibacter flavidus]|uniref:type ISP restriction/modification enzyme n=1 Tax=Mucilaginibacter flavidus TaxID=2949309 RepID=UPI002091F3BE|nr:type ISP restriction/modification enzyme [Mucilaginibacter flavidus]MCO5945403.1 hypothetical protein [Mucilaginibacter flavidus]
MPGQNFFSIAGNPQNIPDFPEDDSTLAYTRAITLQTIHNLYKQIKQQVATRLGLTFINPNEATGEVCYANEPGLRLEFRQSFTATDLLYYIYAALQTQTKQNGGFLKTGVVEIPYPTNVDDFWKMVQTGSRLR